MSIVIKQAGLTEQQQYAIDGLLIELQGNIMAPIYICEKLNVLFKGRVTWSYKAEGENK